MEKREPSLAPEWLRRSRHGSNQLLSSSSHSNSLTLSNHSKNMTSRRTRDVDSVHSPFLDRSLSTNTWRGPSNGFTNNAYNLSRRNIDKDWRERDRLGYKDPCDFDTPFPLRTSMVGRERKQLRQSYSMTTRKHGSHLTQGLNVGLNNSGSINLHNGKGTLPGSRPANISKRTGFDKDFSFFRAEESNGGRNVVRSSSLGLCPAVQSLPIGNSALFSGEGWTSALAEVPNVIEKTGVGSHDNVGNSANLVVRSGEKGIASLRNTQEQSSMLLGQSNPGSQIRHGTIKKLVALKSYRESGVAAIKKSGSLTAASQQTSQVTAFTRSVNSPRDLKGASANMIAGRTFEKKPLLAQTQSRTAFYKALKQNSTINISTDPSNSLKELPANDSSSTHAGYRDEIIERIEKVYEATKRNHCFEKVACPDKIEAKYLKFLGWDENNSEEEVLTEEEIRAFIEQYKKCKSSMVRKLPIIQEASKDATPAS